VKEKKHVTIEALKTKLAINARAIRDGKWINPPTRELVPGDVIRMRLSKYPQHIEAPPNIEAKRIMSYIFMVPSY
jgi:magnesium-transporting ATPase (P-type)